MSLIVPSSLVSNQWLNDNLNHPDLIVLDATIAKVGSKAGQENKTDLVIDGSLFFDLKNIFKNLKNDLPNTFPTPEYFQEAAQNLGLNSDSCIVVYDKEGIYSSARAWWLFKAMGHENVAVLNGGFPAWQKSGFPTKEDYKQLGTKGSFKANLQPEMITYTEDVLKNIALKEYLVLDARSAGRFDASEPEPRVNLRGGHIPGSKSLPHKRLVKNGFMLEKRELETLFSSLAQEQEKLIFSCGSGITACILALGAELAGIKQTQVYDGSWTEWALREDLPIEK